MSGDSEEIKVKKYVDGKRAKTSGFISIECD